MLPECCIPQQGASNAEVGYCAYQKGGSDPTRVGRNYKGIPCDPWCKMDEEMRMKWMAAADVVMGSSGGTSWDNLPECCIPTINACLPEKAYCAYNRGGTRIGLNVEGKPCPIWTALGANVQEKWKAFVEAVRAKRLLPMYQSLKQVEQFRTYGTFQ